ncbi:MAG: J domain-containing protein [Clostridia bacterium]
MNYYEILEVSVNASKEVIKNAYRALIKKYHPDSYKGNKEFAQEKMKKINEAYETLIDDNKRLLYDYDNGFKIDPNAPEKEFVEVKDNIKENYEINSQRNIDIREILKNKKIISVIIAVLFIVAFIIGLVIAGGGSDKKSEGKEESNKTQTIIDTDNKDEDYTNNSTYRPNNNVNYTQDSKTEDEKSSEETKDSGNNSDIDVDDNKIDEKGPDGIS